MAEEPSDILSDPPSADVPDMPKSMPPTKRVRHIPESSSTPRYVVIGTLGGGMEPIPAEQQIEPPPGLPRHTMRIRRNYEHGAVVAEDELHGPHIGGRENVERLLRRGAIIPLDADHPVARAAREREAGGGKR